MHHTKEKGDIAVAKVIGDMAGRGWKIMLPVSEHLPFDLVAYKNKRFLRVQVKYSAGDKPRLDIRQRWSDSKGSYSKYSSKSEVDIYVVYNPDRNRCYYVLPWEFKQQKIVPV